MKTNNGGIVKRVNSGSPAERAAIYPGDILISINGIPVSDILDYRFLIDTDDPELCLNRNGKKLFIKLLKNSLESSGLEFDDVLFDRVIPCRNKCEFCFVQQLPPFLRPGLYIKDDDFRLSFLNGCYVTLTNLSDKDWQKIFNYHLSPLYLSVHSTNPELRIKLLGNKQAGNIIADMQRLTENGIQLYTQAVICPDINDNAELERTVRDCASLYPGVQALGIVPVGLTRFQKSAHLRLHTRTEAIQTIELIRKLQDEFLDKIATPFVQIADEFFLRAETDSFPENEYYENYELLENGIGMCRLFLDEFQELYEPDYPLKPDKIGIITGVAGEHFLKKFILPLMSEQHRKKINIFPVINNFLGQTVTVCGLLSGHDISTQIPFAACDVWLLPQNCLKEEDNIFLDEISLEAIRQKTDKQILAIEPSATAFIQTISEL